MIFSPNFFFLYFFLSIIALVIGTYTDLKERFISNKLTYSMILVGLALHGLQALVEGNYSILLVAGTVTAVTFFFAWGLWKLGAWAGGDVKLFTALAALNPFNYAFLKGALGLNIALLEPVALPVFPLTLFIFSIFSMIPYGAMLAIKAIAKRKDLREKYSSDFKKSLVHAVEFAPLLVGLNVIMAPLKLNALLGFAAIILVLIVYGAIKVRFKQVVVLLLAGNAFWIHGTGIAFSLAYLFLFFLMFFFMTKLFSISRSDVLQKKVRVSDLTEGMIPAESLVEVNGEIKKRPALGIKTIINHLANNRLDLVISAVQPQGKEIISAKKARGLTEKEISELKKLAAENKIEPELMVKLTAPMVPAVLIAFVVLSLIGDLLWNLLFL